MKHFLIATFLLSSMSLTMCKSNKNLDETKAPIAFTVLFAEGTNVKSIISAIEYDSESIKRVSKSQNQWLLKYLATEQEGIEIKKLLLNNDAVISVYDGDKPTVTSSKSTIKGKVSPIKEKQ